ncbi:Taxilin family [Phaffia rhodozyma]|uniref:Taxilin family n=1 Tax=Phaffia rhodozyma TaxID=264483 RepID=A0A0F7SP18_PHARH|nr:Taxilin family [Phaffia rhodozyma]
MATEHVDGFHLSLSPSPLPSSSTTTTTATGSNTPDERNAEGTIEPLSLINQRIRNLKLNELGGVDDIEVDVDEELDQEARKRIHGVSDRNELVDRYVLLYKEFKKQNERALSKTNAMRSKIESSARDLAKESKRLMAENRKLKLMSEIARQEIDTCKTELRSAFSEARSSPFSIPTAAGAPSGPEAIHVRIFCESRKHQLYFKVLRHRPLKRMFAAWTDRVQDMSHSTANLDSDVLPPSSSSSARTRGKSRADTKRARLLKTTSEEAAATILTNVSLEQPGPKFIFCYAGKVIGDEMTPDGIGLDDGDSILAIEVVDLASDRDDDGVPTVPGNPLTKAAKKSLNALKSHLEDTFDSIIQERLKDVLRQYEVREQQFDAILKSKELEILLAKARSEESKRLVLEAKKLMKQQEQLNMKTVRALDELKQSHHRLLDKLLDRILPVARNPSPENTAHLLVCVKEEIDRKGLLVEEIIKGGNQIDL